MKKSFEKKVMNNSVIIKGVTDPNSVKICKTFYLEISDLSSFDLFSLFRNFDAPRVLLIVVFFCSPIWYRAKFENEKLLTGNISGQLMYS